MTATTARPKARKKTTTKKPEGDGFVDWVRNGGLDKPDQAQLENDVDPEREEFIKAFEQKPGEVRNILIGALHPSKFQPRKHFDEDELNQLAALMKAEGQLTDLIVRHRGDNSFEILAGERRLRAAKQLGWKSLRCKVVDCTDAEARRKALFDNKGRADLTEMEEILACRELIDSGVYTKQLDLANDLGITPATLSNRLRVLELPKLWRDLISQENYGLSITHSRPLLTWIERPTVLEKVAKELPELVRYRPEKVVTVRELENQCLNVARSLSRPVKGYSYQYANGNICLSKKDAADPDLDLQQVGDEMRAFNLKLWQQYQDAGAARRKKTSDETGARSSSGGGKTDEEKAEDKKKQKAKRLYRYKVQVLQQKIGQRLRDGGLSDAEALRLMTWFYFQSPNNVHHRIRREVWSAELQKNGAKRITDQYRGDDAWAMSLKVDDKAFITAVHQALISIVSTADFETYSGDMTPEGIEQIAELLGVKFETEWQPTEEFLKLLSVEDLWQLDNEWATHLNESKHPTKAKLIEGLLQSTAKRPFPNVLRKLKAVRL